VTDPAVAKSAAWPLDIAICSEGFSALRVRLSVACQPLVIVVYGVFR